MSCAVSLSCIGLVALLGSEAPAQQLESLCPGQSPIRALPQPDVLTKNGTEAALLRCIAQRRTADAQALLMAGASSPWAPAYAAASGNAALMRELLARGADPDARGPVGDVPILTLAVSRGQREVVEVILEAGADPDLAGDGEFSGGAALSAAVRNGEFALARMLLEHGADANRAESYQQKTPLWELVCRHGKLSRRREFVELLLAHGAHLEARDAGALNGWPHAGRTPLACAVAAGDAELARFLLARGADANALIDGGIRILEFAQELGSAELVRLLEEHHATVERTLPSSREVYQALAQNGFEKGREFYMLGARRIHPERRGEPFASFYRRRELVPYLPKDFDGDGTPELALVLQRPGNKPASLVLVVLGHGPRGWRVLQRRDSLEGNPVISAALEEIHAGIGVHVFEARYQCDDEQPVYYELHWDAARGQVVASESAPYLHPLQRDWNCGE